MFTGQNVQNITKVKRGDIFIDVAQTVVGTVTVPQTIVDAEDALPLGTLLTSTDGGQTWNPLTTPLFEVGSYKANAEVYYKGHIYKSTKAANDSIPDVADWDDLGAWNANGVLYNDLSESKKTTVVVTGSVKENYLKGCDEFLRVTLFTNKIIAK